MKARTIVRLLQYTGVLVALALGVAALTNWNSIRIRYHVMLLQDARRAIGPGNEGRLRYSMHWVRWLAEGRPDRATQQEAGWKHQEALIKLGYCERRVYTLTNGNIVDFNKTLVGHKFKDGLLSFSLTGGMDRLLVVFATKEDFPFLEEKMKEMEEK